MFQKSLEGEKRKKREDEGREKRNGEESESTKLNFDFFTPFFSFLVTTLHPRSVPLHPSKTWVYKIKQDHYLVQEFKCLYIMSNE